MKWGCDKPTFEHEVALAKLGGIVFASLFKVCFREELK